MGATGNRRIAAGHDHEKVFPMLERGWRLLLGVFVLIMALSARGATKTLRVVAANYDPPYLFQGTDGQPQGYLVDLWQLWQKKTGIPVVLEPMPWVAAQRAVLDGQADVIDAIARTSVRDQLYRFSPPFGSNSIGIYVHHLIKGIHGAGSLSGFQIGVERGSACIDKLASLGISSLVPYSDYDALLAAANSGTIKIFCMRDEPAHYYLYLYRSRLKFTRAFTLRKAGLHWAVNQDNASTFALVARGMNLISPAQHAALRHKWFKHPIQYWPYVRTIFLLVLGVLGVLSVATLWIWVLRRAVRAKTVEIRDKNSLLEKQARALEIERSQLRTLVESSPDAMWLKDRNGVYIDCNTRAAELIGFTREGIIGLSAGDVLKDADVAIRILDIDKQAWATASSQSGELSLCGPDGALRDLEIVKVPIKAADGEITGVLGVARDITERLRNERELRIAAVAFESNDGMMITDENGVIERVNAAFTQISGFPASDAIGRMPNFLQSEKDSRKFYEDIHTAFIQMGYWSGEVLNRRSNGELYPVRMSISAVTNSHGKTIHYVGAFQDISAEKEAQAQAEHLKLFDPLTETPNRALLEDRISHALANSIDMNEYGAVIMTDLDDFRKVNDSLGHAAGDQLLLEVSRRIRQAIQQDDTLGRFSGDTFVVMLENLGPDRHLAAARASAVAERIRQSLAEPSLLEEQSVVCTGSVGITLFPGENQQPSAETLLRQADLALHKSKDGGRNMVRVFEDEMQADLDTRNNLESELREAIKLEHFALYYQPQVDAQGRLIGAEALVRWNHPMRGLIPPAAFIPLAEETGLIEPIGQWVITAACRQLRLWADRDSLRDLALAINISARQFKSNQFVASILSDLRRSGARANHLKLEVTESLAIDDFESSIGKLRELKAHGFKISLDDFGTGNSSLTYLTKLPLTQLKIDKSFVDALPDSHTDAMVAQTIIAMGQGLELDVIAEGVETEAQYRFLAAQGCHAFQGYLFGKPMPLSEFESQVDAWKVTASGEQSDQYYG